MLVTLRRRRSLPLAILSALALSSAALVGCTPEAEPSPTPTAAFASEEEAFAAAEEVYRAYNDAGNARRDAAESPSPDDFLIGSALEGYLDGQEYLRTNGIHLAGDIEVLSFVGETAEFEAASATIIANVCFDVSATRLLNEAGEDVTPGDRREVQAQRVTFDGTPDALLISSEAESDAATCAQG